MSRQILCIKLNEETEGMNAPPFPGPLGKRIYNEVSKRAWQMWLEHQTMLINEYRLSLMDPKAREFLQNEMKDYFFGEGSKKPDGFSPEK
tara:strand:+ start:19 stop:288 length:270 start_codon:yes stop_codon:yes gene_type:complete